MKRILFIELLGGIGDLIIALPAIKALALSHPQARIAVLTFPPGGELLQSDRHIHEVIFAQRGAARQSVAQILTQQNFDLIVSDVNYDGITELIHNSGANKRTVTNLWRNPPDNQLISDRFCQILYEEGLIATAGLRHGRSPQPPLKRGAIGSSQPDSSGGAEKRLSPPLLKGAIGSSQPDSSGGAEKRLSPPFLRGVGGDLIHLLESEIATARQTFGAAYRPLVFLIPDSAMPIKRWSTQNFITVGKALQQKYNATIIVAGGDDEEMARQIKAEIDKTARIWQRGTLRELAAGISQADLAIAVDTGPAHIAAALNVPTITLFGPAWHERYGQPAPHINLQGYPECSERVIRNFTEQSCWYSGVCPFDWHSCTEDISVASVLAAAAKFLDRQEELDDPPLPPFLRGELEAVRDTAISLPPAEARETAAPSPQLVAPETTAPLFKGGWGDLRNILVMRLDNIGDVIMTSPVLRTIKENLPTAKLTLMASPAGALTQPLLPWVDEVLSWRVLWQDLGRLDFDPAREWKLIETLNQRQFDAAIILTSFSQSPYPAALVCYLAGIGLRLGESKESGQGILTHWVDPLPDEIHQVERNLRLIEAVGFKVRDRRLCLHVPQTITAAIPNSYILLNPWTTCQSRNYDDCRFATAARQLSQMTSLPIVVTGTNKDRDRARPLLDILGDAIDLIGATSLAEFAALIANARLVLTNNTSTMHIADATNTPSVILFAGTELESQWQPCYAPVKLLRRPTVCSPCYAFTCPYNMECLDISPEEVIAAGLEMLDRTNSNFKFQNFRGYKNLLEQFKS
ncbi:glycosyltransferase family 9 protein [Chroococcidiopsis thermalis]|uniref:Glycosyl transferase family 9 n=1 Tax=Chroococcidiopsis thermalis (strain PCC 7203) TaxID=251229 RepID=K9U0D1_CHRTP|nr:glycosyltransferase family 9 protein [Chroococcidiopsis thermalis]AFY87699.1 glycosyl transferase family 9 [Chroococcidiopsis thermalis PCC 7203]